MSVLVRMYVRKRKHSTAQQHSRNNENETKKFRNKNNPRPLSSKNFLPDWNILLSLKSCQEEKREKSNRRASLSASYAARPSRNHLATDSVRVKLSSLSASVMLPSCFEAHATPSHQSGDRAPCNPPSTRHHPLTPVTVPRSPAVPYSEYTRAHETKEEKRREND